MRRWSVNYRSEAKVIFAGYRSHLLYTHCFTICNPILNYRYQELKPFSFKIKIEWDKRREITVTKCRSNFRLLLHFLIHFFTVKSVKRRALRRVAPTRHLVNILKKRPITRLSIGFNSCKIFFFPHKIP